MKQKYCFLIIAALVFTTCPALAATHVRGHITKSGTYVAPHARTSPDSTRLNNYSTKGNVNPYTGKVGYAKPYKASKGYR